MFDLDPELELLGKSVVDAAFRVHQVFGPGLLERVYESALVLELQSRGISVERQVQVPILYLGHVLEDPLRLDLLISKRVVIEVKAVESILPVHKAQLMTYLKLSNFRLGFLINFNVAVFKHGIQRVVL